MRWLLGYPLLYGFYGARIRNTATDAGLQTAYHLRAQGGIRSSETILWWRLILVKSGRQDAFREPLS